MTIEEHLLINIYAEQKVYSMRTIDLLCGIMERVENKDDDPLGLFSIIVRENCDKMIVDLIANIHKLRPENTPFAAIHGIPDEVVKKWLDEAVVKAFEDGDNNLDSWAK